MKNQNICWQIAAKTVSLSFAFPVLIASAATAGTVNRDSSALPSQGNILEPPLESQATQNVNACYQVIAEYGMYVREEPSVYGEAIAILNYGQNVAIVPGGTEYWVPISDPIRGYVWADWLVPC